MSDTPLFDAMVEKVKRRFWTDTAFCLDHASDVVVAEASEEELLGIFCELKHGWDAWVNVFEEFKPPTEALVALYLGQLPKWPSDEERAAIRQKLLDPQGDARLELDQILYDVASLDEELFVEDEAREKLLPPEDGPDHTSLKPAQAPSNMTNISKESPWSLRTRADPRVYKNQFL